MTPDRICVILPTIATSERADCLDRAVRSVLAQEGVSIELIVVANGPRCDPEILAELRRSRNVRVVVVEQASFSHAIQIGRSLVNAPYFTELDDDDELLPQALAIRLECMEAAPSIDVVITSGFVRSGGFSDINISDFTRVRVDPVRALLDSMWLVPCAALYRTATVTADLFEEIPASLEWTYLAFLLALRKRISFIDKPTFVYNRDTRHSLSKSKTWIVSQPAALRQMMRLDLPPDVKSRLRMKYVSALHSASDAELNGGHRGQAWRWHLMSLGHRSGWQYVSYTRHLFGRYDRGARA
jgi:glycosyltransferase involved in cell wall biosynthesis